MLFLLACTGKAPEDTGPAVFTLRADDHVALPYTTQGDPVPLGYLQVWDAGGGGSEGSIEVDAPGDFDIDGDTRPLAPGEERELAVRFAGSNVAGIYAGTLTLTVDRQVVEVELAAAIGDPALPDADWSTDEWGSRATLAMPSAPFPYGDAPYTDSSVLLFVPEGLTDDDGVDVVCHLHGHDATLAEIVEEHALVEQQALSGRDALLIVPQGPVNAADSDFGRLDEAGGFAALVRDAVTVLYRDGFVDWPAIGAAVVTAHSGGYSAAANIVDRGGLPISAVHLFDALYGRADIFAAFAEAGGVLRSGYTAEGGTDAENEDLAATLAGAGVTVGGLDDRDLDAGNVSIGFQDCAHMESPTDERAFARWLAASGLPPRPNVAPELRSVVSDGANAVVKWRADKSGAAITVRVEGSDDGDTWEPLTTTLTNEATVEARPWVRLVRVTADHGDSAPSDAYPGDGDAWLVVDGFDRVLGGSWTAPTHSFAASVCASLGEGCSGASNEAVAFGEVDLAAYDHVIWLLGDESTADRTFDDAERAAISAYVQGGGDLVVSGSEVGYATDPAWLSGTLHATYVADDAGTNTVESWTVGAAYPEDYPDVLDGDEVLWTWSTGGAAAVGWNHQVAVVGFGLENLSDTGRAAALADLAGWLE